VATGNGAAQAPFVPAARIRLPRIRSHRRRRLDEKLASLWDRRLGLIVAPAGSGKTTLLVQFAERAGVPVAFYRAEPGDAEAGRFLPALEQACRSAFEPLHRGWRSSADAAEALEAWPGGRGLVIVDDLHTLYRTEAEEALGRLVDYLPPSIYLLAGSRRVPGIDLSRLRLAGGLLELGPDDLRFRSWEVESLFRDFYGEPLPPEDLAELTRRTGGWSAGLQLFHLATKGKPTGERRRLVAELGPRWRLVREYLARNVLDELPDELRRFLVETSVLGRLTGPLCDELLGRSGSAAILEELERRQIFTTAIDEATWRYHEVLRSHLEVVLVEDEGDESVRRRYARAAALLEAAGASADAVRAYCRAEDWDAAVRLLGRVGEQLVGEGADWAALPARLADNDPWLLLAGARRHLASGHPDDALAAYQAAEVAFGTAGPAAICRRERLAVTEWLRPGTTGGTADWVTLIRAATRRNPLDVMEAAGHLPGAAAGLARGVAALLAGRIRLGRDLLLEVAERPDASPLLAVGARIAAQAAGWYAGPPPEGVAALADEADRLAVPWLVRLARALAVTAPGPAATGEAAALATLAEAEGDRWGTAIITFARGAQALVGGQPAVAPLEAAVRAFHDLDAGVPEAWAQASLALAQAMAGHRAAAATARAAEGLARGLGVPGAQALALLARGAAEPERAAEHVATAAAVDPEGDVVPVSQGGSPAPGIERPAPEFVGRGDELAELLVHLDSARAGAGGVVAVIGEAGVGKTRLVEQLVGQARGRGVREVAVTVTDEVARLAEDLAAAATTGPCLAVIEDVHRVQATVAAGLAQLDDELAKEPVLVVVLGRPPAPDDPLAPALAALDPRRLLRLRGLPPSDLETFVGRTLPGPRPAGLTGVLHRRTGGNPLFTLEILAMLGRQGGFEPEQAAAAPVPAVVRHAVVEQLVHLPAATVELLRVGAVVGTGFDLATLRSTLEMSEIEVLERLAPALQVGVVEELGSRRFRFTNELSRDVVYERIDPVQRAAWHERVGGVLERRGSDRSPAMLAELTHHFSRAAGPGTAGRAVGYALRAGDQALNSGAMSEAAEWYRTALDLAEGGSAGDEATGRALVGMGRAEALAGRRREGRRLLLQAADLARSTGNRALLARAALEMDGVPGDILPRDNAAQALLREAREAYGAEDDPMAALLETRLAAGAYRTGDAARFTTLAAQAWALAARTGDPRAQARALEVWHWAIAGPDDLTARTAVADDMIAAASKAGDTDVLLRAHRYRLRDALEAGDQTAADRQLNALAAFLDEPGGTASLELGSLRATRALLEGRFAAAEELSQDTLNKAPAGRLQPVEEHLAQMLVLRREQGRVRELEAQIRSVVDQPSSPAWRPVLAWVEAETGRLAEAAARLERFVSPTGLELAGQGWLPSAFFLAETCARVGDRRRADVLYRALRPWQGRVVVVGLGVACLGTVDDALGRLSAAAGRLRLAERHFEAALGLARRLGARPLAARTACEYAAVLRQRGAEGRADRLLGEARHTAGDLGLAAVLARAEEVSGAAAPSAEPAPAGGAVVAPSAASPVEAPRAVLRCLGRFRLELDGREIDLTRAKPRVRQALRLLASRAGDPVHRESIVEALWPDAELKAGMHNLQVTISSLRRLLEPKASRGESSLVVRQGDAYRLALPEPADIDLVSFEDAVAESRSALKSGAAEAAVAALDRALAAYGGDLLPEDGPAEWVVGRREALRTEAAEAAVSRARLALEDGDEGAAAVACEWGLRIDRYHDTLWRLLIRTRRQAGDRAAAERAQRSYEEALAELGLSVEGD